MSASADDVIVLFDFVDDEDDDSLSDDEQAPFAAKKYDLLKVVEVQGEWLTVLDARNRDGFIPTAFTSRIDWSQLVYSAFRYTPQTPDQLAFDRGDAIVVAKRYEDGWAEGIMMESGAVPSPMYRWRPSDRLRIGLFPLNFTTQTRPSSSSTPVSVSSGAKPNSSLPGGAASSGPNNSNNALTNSNRGGAGGVAGGVFASAGSLPPVVPAMTQPHKQPAGPSNKYECNRRRSDGSDRELTEAELYRCKVIDEMVNTERDYIDAMELMLRLFLEPLKSNKLLDKKSIQTIFGGIPELLALNKRLLAALLEEADKPVAAKRMGEAFLRNTLTVAMTEPYAAYCAQHQRASDLIREQSSAKTAKGAEFAAWLKEAHATPSLNMRQLSSFVILPVQRVCKYPLLLKELVKRTPADHVDAEPLMRAQKAVEVLTAAVNERTKDIENQMKIAELVSRCAGLDKCNPQRYIRDGQFFDHSPLQKKGPQQYHYYLFSNCLVRAKQNKNKMRLKPLKVKEVIPIDLCVVVDVDDTPALKHVIDVSHMGTANKYRLAAANADAKESWLIDFEKLLTEVRAEEARLQELDKRRRASTTSVAPAQALARGTSGTLSKPLPSLPPSHSAASTREQVLRAQQRSQTVSLSTMATGDNNHSVWTPGSFRQEDGAPMRRASGGNKPTGAAEWSPGAQRSTVLGQTATSNSVRQRSNGSASGNDESDDDDDDLSGASPPAPASRTPSASRIFGSSKALEAHANHASQFAAARMQRPPSRPPPRLGREGSQTGIPPVPSTPPPSIFSSAQTQSLAPPLPSTPPPPMTNSPAATAALVGPQFVEEVLNGAKQVILAGKKLVLHSRDLGPGNDPSDDETMSTTRELAKQTYVLLSIVTTALQDVAQSPESVQLQAVAKDARGAVLELVDAAKSVKTDDASTAHLRLEDEYKKLVNSVKNIVAMSQSFAEATATAAN